MKPIETTPAAPTLVSVHGGHSGEFCLHAKDSLEEMIKRYIELDFTWVGITEHLPAWNAEFMYPDEIAANLTPDKMLKTFESYMEECNRLKQKYRSKLKIFTAFEIESCSGYDIFVPEMVKKFKPDYIVGSVHHVNDLGFDFSKTQYLETAKKSGGMDALYANYFDLQYEMLRTINPAVAGHFDLIRIFDADYNSRIKKPLIWQKIVRNLECIKDQEIVMDYNLRALTKGAAEPYIATPILKLAGEMGIRVVPGEDSHSVEDIGRHMEGGIKTLQNLGFATTFQPPRLYLW
jgi:histidinol-phosphatase (PHP family)